MIILEYLMVIKYDIFLFNCFPPGRCSRLWMASSLYSCFNSWDHIGNPPCCHCQGVVVVVMLLVMMTGIVVVNADNDDDDNDNDKDDDDATVFSRTLD